MTYYVDAPLSAEQLGNRDAMAWVERQVERKARKAVAGPPLLIHTAPGRVTLRYVWPDRPPGAL